MQKLFPRFSKTVSGATAIEYALIAGGIALVIVAAVGAVGDQLVLIFQDVRAGLPN